MTELRSAYLYARNNGCDDDQGAKFADWFVGSHYEPHELPVRFAGWLDRSLSDA